MMFSKVSEVYKQFSETSCCRLADPSPDKLNQNLRGMCAGKVGFKQSSLPILMGSEVWELLA